MPIKFIKNIFGKSEAKKAAAPQPTPAPVEQTPAKPINISKMSMADITAHVAQQAPVERPLRTVMDEVSSQLIAKGNEPYVATGVTVQDMGRSLTSDAPPCAGFDEAVISALEQLAHHCQYDKPEVLAKALELLQAIITGRNQAVVDTPRGLLQLKYHAQTAQLIAQQGQLAFNAATIQKYRKTLDGLNQNPSLDPMGQRRQSLKLQLDQMQRTRDILISNLGAVQDSIRRTEVQMESTNLEVIDIVAEQRAIAEEISAQRKMQEDHLHAMVAAQQYIEAIDNGNLELDALTIATQKQIAQSNQAMNSVRANYTPRQIYTDPIEATPTADMVDPAELAAETLLEEEEPPMMDVNFMDF